MAALNIDGGRDTARIPATSEDGTAERECREAAARNVVSGIVADLTGVRGQKEGTQSPELRAAKRLRAEFYDMLGLPEVEAVETEPVAPPAAATLTEDSGEGRDVVTPRLGSADDDWRHFSACRDEDPELFFPIGTSGPALLQAEQAKAVCRRCDVVDDCLAWALRKQEFGVAGGMDEDERRAVKRRGGLRVTRS